MKSGFFGVVAVASLGLMAQSALAQCLEAEANDSRATANPCVISAGGTITGNTTSASGVGFDYFRVQTAPLPLGIYRHRLLITSTTPGHAGTIRGNGQTAAPADTLPGIPWNGVVGAPNTTELAAQTSSTATTPARFNQWYGFGKSEEMYYRVTGGAGTTADYVATMETVPVVATPIGIYAPGLITIDTFAEGHSTDTDLKIYDSNLNAILGYENDDESVLAGTPGTGATLQSWLPRTYAPGTYFLAISNFHLSNNNASASDDDFRTGNTLDFPNIIVNSSTTANLNMQFTIADSLGTTLTVPNTKLGAYDVNWFTFTVTPEPGSLALLAVGGLALIRRRRA